MAFVRALLAACVLGAALLLHGCGGGGGTPAPTPAPPTSIKTTVIVMRHCARSTGVHGILANPEFADYDDYAHDAWREFPVPPYHCLPRGTTIVEEQGKWLKRGGGLPLPIRAIADDISNGQRDNVTMHAFLKGLAYEAGRASTSVSSSPFSYGLDTPACNAKLASTEAKMKAVQAALDSSPPPDSEMLQKLYTALGEGAAGDWTGIPCKAGGAADYFSPVGACQAASQFTERLVMELGGGFQPLGFGVKASDVPALLGLHTWWFNRWNGVPEIFNRDSASIAAHVSASLNKAEPGTTLYVGHDGNIAGLASVLGLSYIPSPYPANAALPGSMLRFDRDGDQVSVSYMYVGSFVEHSADGDGTMLSVNANFTASSNTIALAQFDNLISQNTFAECADMSDIAPPKTDEVLAV